MLVGRSREFAAKFCSESPIFNLPDRRRCQLKFHEQDKLKEVPKTQAINGP
jgi:hypothetical protein